MPVDPTSHVPIYEQIIAHVRGRIAAGAYRADEPLPSVRAMAGELLVNPNTVQRAYQELERQGLARSRKGVGMFVAAKGPEIAAELAAESVYATFRQGIATGRSAQLAFKRLRTVFNSALDDHTQESSS